MTQSPTQLTSDELIASPEQVTPQWLTRVLRRSGVLAVGGVKSFEWATRERELSTNARIEVRYTKDARGELPRRLFLKLVDADMEDEFFGPSEVDYYIRDYAGVEGTPIVRCYDAAYSLEQRRYHLLLDDLSESHTMARAKAPALDYGRALAEGLAAMHAHWWGAERLAAGGEPIPTAAAINRFVEVARPGATRIIEGCARELKPHWPDLLHEIFEHHPALMVERVKDGRGFTLIHGDVNPGNVLVPPNGWRPLYIVDRQPFDWSLTTWLGVYDLAYPIVLYWDPELRRAWERPILRHYHDCLVARGIEDYGWQQLLYDYRLCAVICVYVAVEWCRGRLNLDTMRYWLPMLQKSLTAVDDLACAKLWQIKEGKS